MSFHPANLAAAPLNSVLMRVALWVGGLERRLAQYLSASSGCTRFAISSVGVS
jgi:hypothetical protein